MTEQQAVWSVNETTTIKSFTLTNFRTIPQIQQMSEEAKFEMEVVGNVLPFKTNNYVVEQLIDWDNIPKDPMFVLTFPQKGMLIPEHYDKMASTLRSKADKKEIKRVANDIRLKLNPHPAGQMELNVPELKDGTKLYGMQHKYDETCLFFPSQSQTCHAYCSFCFRWPQFVGMAPFNHLVELSTDPIKEAIKRVRNTGVQIRTQSPLLAHINDDANMWANMWQKQVSLGCIPYYMFVVRDTGAQHYFGVPLVKAEKIFRSAFRQVSGLARTVRGPSMSATPGKVHVLGVSEINGQKIIALQLLQGRDSDWVGIPFYAKYDENAIWLDDLKPAFSEKFFFEDMFNTKYKKISLPK